jgi:outer membrane protein insertion porin family
MQHPMLRALPLVVAALVVPLPGRAQNADTSERPRVERIVFDGAEELDRNLLRRAIVNEESRCRAFLLRPLCAIANWRAIEIRRRLIPEELEADALRLRVYYFQRGFRSTDVDSEVRPRPDGSVDVYFRIAEGPPTIVDALDVTQSERVLSDRQIRRTGLPREGERADLLRFTAGLVNLNRRLGQRGYLDAEVHDTIALSTDELRARLSIHIETNRRATLRGYEISGNEDVSDRTIRDALRLREGRVLRTNDVVASQRSLYESNLFHEARVRVPQQPDSAKIVEITVREAPPRGARVGGGFNTIEFVQTEARFTHHNWLGGGRRLDVRATVGNLLAEQLNARGLFRDVLPTGIAVVDEAAFLRPAWLASAEIMQPAFRSAANAIGINAFAHRRIVPAIAIDEGFGGEVSFTRRFDHRTPASLIYRYELTRVQAGDLYFCVNYAICETVTIDALRERHSLSPVMLSFYSDRGNHPIAPSSGTRLRLDVEHASALTGSSFQHHRISGEVTRYVPIDIRERRVIAGRLRAGWVHPLEGTAARIGVGDEADRLLHPRKRFYAGGARSVRGFRENQLGPRVLTIDPDTLLAYSECDIINPACDPDGVPADAFVTRPVGGTAVLEASAEFRFPIRRFQGAVFVDGAVVGERLGGFFTEGVRGITPGAGVRFGSPVGPIRVDLGLRPRHVQVLPVFTEAIDEDGFRHLVRLDEERLYDPLAERGGLGRILRRLTLHLAIGEAF